MTRNCILQSLNSVDQTIVAEASIIIIDFVHTKFSNTTKFLTTALTLGKMFMESVNSMASDALSEEDTDDAKNHQLFPRCHALVVSGRHARGSSVWPTLVVHTQPNFCRVLIHT